MIESRLYRLRDAIRVGDKLYVTREVKTDSDKVLERRMEKVTVVEKFPHLVRVKGAGPELPIQTVTYNEILVTDATYAHHNRYMLKGNSRLQKVAWSL